MSIPVNNSKPKKKASPKKRLSKLDAGLLRAMEEEATGELVPLEEFLAELRKDKLHDSPH